MQKLVGRNKAVHKVLGDKMTEAFKKDFYDDARECYKTKGLGEFIQSIKEMKAAAQQDDDLAEQFGNARIG